MPTTVKPEKIVKAGTFVPCDRRDCMLQIQTEDNHIVVTEWHGSDKVCTVMRLSPQRAQGFANALLRTVKELER